MFDFLDYIRPFFLTSLGIALFVPFYATWVILLLPGLWLSMFAGLIYGTKLATLLVFLGAFLGAEISFLFGRTFLSEWALNKLALFPRIKAVEKAVTEEGLKLIILTRLSPAFPFSLLNLMYGLSSVSWKDFTIGLLGILPGTFVFCGLGSLAGDLSKFKSILTDSSDQNSLILKIIGLLSTFLIVFSVSQRAKKIINNIS